MTQRALQHSRVGGPRIDRENRLGLSTTPVTPLTGYPSVLGGTTESGQFLCCAAQPRDSARHRCPSRIFAHEVIQPSGPPSLTGCESRCPSDGAAVWERSPQGDVGAPLGHRADYSPFGHGGQRRAGSTLVHLGEAGVPAGVAPARCARGAHAPPRGRYT